MKTLELPTATPDQWEAAFRKMEATYAGNKARHWVLVCLRDALRTEASKAPEYAENKPCQC